MSLPSSTQLISLHHHHSKPLSPPNPTLSSSQILSGNPKLNPSLISQNPLSMETDLTIGFRYISTGGSKRDVNLLKMDAFWRRNSLVLLGVFIGLSEGMATYGFLALYSAIVAFAGLYLRSRFTINPNKVYDTVYRMAMRKLNTSADILEIMGAPLTGTDLRATLKNFKARLRSTRCFLIFPIRGVEMKGLVNVEVKNKKGQYDMKLQPVDIPMATGPDQRLFLIGDEEEYRISGGFISELRDPVVKAMSTAKEFEAYDIKDAQRELKDAERKHHEEIEREG